VRGCLFWQQQGLNPPLAVTEAAAKYQRNEDLLGDFIDACCARNRGAKVQSKVIYQRYVEWYKENIDSRENKQPTSTTFGKQLSQIFEKHRSNGCVFYDGIDVLLTPSDQQQGELGT